MASYTDSQVLKLLVRRLNELYECLPKESLSPDFALFDAGSRSVLESLMSFYDFLVEYDDEL